MAVRVGSARHDENDKLKGGKAGDQTGVEVSKQNWYLHKKGWIVIRPKDAKVRELIAQDMEWACENPNIGYDQSQNQTLYNEAKKYGFNCSMVKIPCETDCSRLVRVCLAYAGIHTPVFYTGNEVEVLKKTGKFDILTSDKYCKSSQYLLRGDILCTKTTGHTVIVLTNGSKVSNDSLKKGSEGDKVAKLQNDLNKLGYPDDEYEPLKVDGDFGKKTEQAVKRLQKYNDLKVDGICGPKTWAKIEELLKAKPKQVEALRSLVVHKGKPRSDSPKKAIIKKGAVVEYSFKENGWLYLPRWNGWITSRAGYVKIV